MKKQILLSVLILFFVLSGQVLSAQSGDKPEVQTAKYFDVSKPLTEMTALDNTAVRKWKDGKVKNHFRTVKTGMIDKNTISPNVQKTFGMRGTSAPSVNIEGTNNGDNDGLIVPPDTQGDAGPNHYVQMTNNVTEIYDKSGNVLVSAFNSSAFWNGFNGAWTGTNDGDPIVLYDEQADRWLVSQFAVSTEDDSQWELLAVSTTNDPTGTYYRYAFQFTDMPDYPKLGIWRDGYYMTANRFTVASGGFNGTYAVAFNRDEMLAGNANARMIKFEKPYTNGDSPFSMLPADCDGDFPPAGTPNYFVFDTDNDTYGSVDRVAVWAFTANWTTPANSTFVQANLLTPTSFNSSFSSDVCIDQPSTSEDISVVADRLMFRAQYRYFGTHAALVLSRTVNMGSDKAAVRWYELRKTGLNWTIYQEGTYAPNADSRWMSSIAMNGQGDIALGYSVSGSVTFPSIRYTGRKAGDPLGQMTITEESIKEGTASQTGGGERWGDYSMMSVDPSDDYSFWYTTQYTSGDSDWKTRIAKFTFPSSCISPTTQASAFSVSAIQDNALTINWTRGNGDAVIVLASKGSAVSAAPVTGTAYNANSEFALGQEIGTGNFVVYIGTENTATVTGLDQGSTYHFAVMEYFNADNCYNIDALIGSETTTGTAPCVYCYAYGNTTYGTSITSVSINTLTKTSAKDTDTNGNAYSDFTNVSTTLIKGTSYPTTIKLNTADDYKVFAKLWIDWNQDCDFDDAGESYDFGSAQNVSNGNTSASPKSITVPLDAALGETTMRVACEFKFAPTSCGEDFDGEVEDYTVVIESGVAVHDISGSGITVGPNPTSGELEINVPERAEIEITDATGRTILKQSAENGRNRANIAGNASGIYFVKINMSGKTYGTSVILK